MVLERETRAAKRQIRYQLLAARAMRAPLERIEAADGLATHLLTVPEIVDAHTVACYVSTPEEPSTSAVIAALTERGTTVLLPILRSDFDLDWAPFEEGYLHPARFGILEPSGTPLGLEAISDVDAVICPALAVDVDGHRLGRGGGSYDRALARAPHVTRLVLCYDEEVIAHVPVGGHDQQVDIAVTPSAVHRLAPREHKGGSSR